MNFSNTQKLQPLSMKDRIYIKHWLELKPKNYSSPTDFYYLKIANTIYSEIKNYEPMLSTVLKKNEQIEFSCFITCYFEDIISKASIWHTFKTLYYQFYKKKLPFFDIDEDYIDDEINYEDVTFLIGYYMNTLQTNKFISPYNNFIKQLAYTIMNIFEEEYEYAPENHKLKKIYQFNGNFDEFYEVRTFMRTIFFDTFLLKIDIHKQLNNIIIDILDTNKEESFDTIELIIREAEEEFTHKRTSKLLALNAKDWVKAIIGKTHKHYSDIDNISKKVLGVFLYKKQNAKTVFVEHIASGMPFEITKKSLEHHQDFNKDDIVHIGLVRYRNEWWFSGSLAKQPFDADLILDKKNSREDRAKVNFLQDQKKLRNSLKKQELAFLKFNHNSHLVFINGNKINDFLSNFYAYYNNSLKLTPDQIENYDKRTKKDGYLKTNKKQIDLFYSDEDEEKVVMFFNPNSGIEMYHDITNAFPDEQNPFFTGEDVEEVKSMLMNPFYSVELVNYFMKNYKDKLSLFKKEPYKSYLKDLDFLLRFWKQDNYKAEIHITHIDEK